MSDPIITTGHTIGYVGILALLVVWFDPATADVLMVIFSSLSGCLLAIRDMKMQRRGLALWNSLKFILIGVMISLIVSWPLVALLVAVFPTLAGPYATSLVALVVGYNNQKIPQWLVSIFNRMLIK